MTPQEIIGKLRADAAELQEDLERWPVEHRGSDRYGGYNALREDMECWMAAADLIEKSLDTTPTET